MPNLRQLEYLVALSETLHFRRAAERVNTTQPTLSEQLKTLEVRLGVQLVERSRNKVLLTPVGRQTVAIARRMLADANEIRSLASQGSDHFSGVFKLGLPPTIGPYLLPKLIPELHQKYSELRLYVREGIPKNLLPELQDGHHDLVISLLPANGPDFCSQPLFSEPLHLVVASDHPYAAAKKIPWEELAGEDVLTLGEGHQLHEAVRLICDRVGSNLRTDYEGTSLDTLREMVAMNLGVSFLPGLFVTSVVSRDPSVKVVEIDGDTLSRNVGLIWREASANHDRYLELGALIRSEIGKHFPDFTILNDD